MGVYKEGKNWKVQVYYKDWQGNRLRKQKRGFKTKGEAKEWERDFLQQQKQSVDMGRGSAWTNRKVSQPGSGKKDQTKRRRTEINKRNRTAPHNGRKKKDKIGYAKAERNQQIFSGRLRRTENADCNLPAFGRVEQSK